MNGYLLMVYPPVPALVGQLGVVSAFFALSHTTKV